MATFAELYAQQFPGSTQSVYEAGSEGGSFTNQFVPTQLTADNFLKMSPEARNLFFSEGIDPSWVGKNVTLWGNTPHTISGVNDPMLLALRGDFLAPEQLSAALAGTQYESLAPAIAQARTNTLAQNEYARNNDDFIHQLGIFGPLLVGAGGMALSGLGGAGAAGSASGGATAGGAATGLEGLTAADLGLEALPFTTNPSLASLGGVVGADGLPVLAGAGAAGAAGAASGGATAAGAAAASTPLSRLLGLDQQGADLLSVLGTAGAVGLGAYGAGQQGDALRDIAAQGRADRAPFLGAATNYLNDPNAYLSGPGQATLDAVLRKLSATHGNPIDSPTALGIATQAGLADWRDAVTGFGNLGLAGEDTRANLMAGAARADSGIYDALGYGLQQATQPRRGLGDFLKGLV